MVERCMFNIFMFKYSRVFENSIVVLSIINRWYGIICVFNEENGVFCFDFFMLVVVVSFFSVLGLEKVCVV